MLHLCQVSDLRQSSQEASRDSVPGDGRSQRHHRHARALEKLVPIAVPQIVVVW